MGVYVKGMEMPKSCSDCLFFVDGLYDANDWPCSACLAKEDNSPSGCGYKEIDGIDHMTTRMDYCPLVEVPEPHGRLIEAPDVSEYEVFDEDTGTREISLFGLMECHRMVEDAPTVIEAEDE